MLEASNLRSAPFRLRSRASLVAATVALQALVIGAGAVLTFNVLESQVSARLRSEQMRDTGSAAERFAASLEHDVRGAITPGTEAWTRAQRAVEAFSGSDGSFAVVLDAQNHLLCHPKIRGKPGLATIDYSDLVIDLGGEHGTISLGTVTPWSTVTGRSDFLNGPVLLGVVNSPSLHAKVVLVQPQETIAAAGQRVTDGMLWIALGSAGLVLALTGCGSLVLVRRYDSMLMRINRDLEQEVVRKVKAGLEIRNALIFGLAKLADYRDTDTGKHLERISIYCDLLARELRPRFPEIDDAWMERLRLASSMHDIGKVGIPDAILLKPGALTPDERRIMEQHPLIGADTLVAIRRRVGDDDLLNMGIQVALYHHERIDGTGYPFGLKGEEIALSARIVALADVYDAMTSVRVYKPALSHEQAYRLIAEARGTHLDERVVDAFMTIHHKVDQVRRELQPDASDPEKPALIAVMERIEEARKRKAA